LDRSENNSMRKRQSGKARKAELNDATGLLCIIASFLLPVFMIVIFYRLVSTWGAPVAYLCLHGVMTVLTVFQLVLFLRKGLFRAVRNYFRSKGRKETEQ